MPCTNLLLVLDSQVHIRQTSLPLAIAPVAGDARRVEQILLNPLSNAIKFTQDGEVVLGVCAGAAALRVSVRDMGIGIKTQDTSRLFQPFSQVDEGLAHPRRQRTGPGHLPPPGVPDGWRRRGPERMGQRQYIHIHGGP